MRFRKLLLQCSCGRSATQIHEVGFTRLQEDCAEKADGSFLSRFPPECACEDPGRKGVVIRCLRKVRIRILRLS